MVYYGFISYHYVDLTGSVFKIILFGVFQSMKWPNDNLIPDIDNNNQLVTFAKPDHIVQDEYMIERMKKLVRGETKVLSVTIQGNGIPSDISYSGPHHRVSSKDPMSVARKRDTRQPDLHSTLFDWPDFRDSSFHYVSTSVVFTISIGFLPSF